VTRPHLAGRIGVKPLPALSSCGTARWTRPPGERRDQPLRLGDPRRY